MVDTATAIEGDLGDAGLDGTLANELTDLLRSLLVRGVGALELGLEGRGPRSPRPVSTAASPLAGRSPTQQP